MSNLKTNLASVNKKLDEAIAILQANQNVKPHQYSMGPYMYPTTMMGPSGFQSSWFSQYGYVLNDTPLYTHTAMPGSQTTMGNGSMPSSYAGNDQENTDSTSVPYCIFAYKDPPSTLILQKTPHLMATTVSCHSQHPAVGIMAM